MTRRAKKLNKIFSVFSVLTLLFNIFFAPLSTLVNDVHAQAAPGVVWPNDWSTPSCTVDPSDESPSQLDLLGDADHSAAYFAKDDNYLYLRERIEGDPHGSGHAVFTQHNWVVVDDQDGNGFYDYLFSLNGKDDLVQIWKKETSLTPIDWTPIFNDPADTVIWEQPVTDYTKIEAADSGYWFVYWAVPLTVGDFTLSDNAVLYFTTSADANNANKDHLNCYEEPPSSITVVKNTVPDSAADFLFTVTGQDPFFLDDDADPTLPNSTTFSGLTAGAYSVTEAPDPNYDTNVVCLNQGQDEKDPAGFDLGIGEDVTCTFTNTKRSFLKVYKVTDPQEDVPTEFGATLTDGDISIGDEQSLSVGSPVTFEVDPGTYWVNETTIPDGWSGDDSDCQQKVVNQGDFVECTIYNTKLGSITVEKITDPDSSQETFDFDLGGDATDSATGIGNGGSYTFDDLLPGLYSLAEQGKDGWDLTNSYCDNQDDPSTIDLGAGENITCTFENTLQRGSIFGYKWLDADGNSGTTGDQTSVEGLLVNLYEWVTSQFNFLNSTYTDSSGYYEFTNLLPGTYKVEEDLSSLDASWFNVDPTESGDIVVDPGQTEQYDFVNSQYAHIIVEKNAVPDSDTEFLFNNDFGNNNPAQFGLIDDSATGLPSYNAEVLPGTYSVSEVNVDGWKSPQSVSCSNQDSADAITVASGETVTCTFTNQQLAKITLVKNTVGGDGDFSFNATGDGLPSTIDLSTSSGVDSESFENLDPDNSYSIAEVGKDGWSLESAICDNGDPVSNITPNAGEEITCTFINQGVGTITVNKDIDYDNDGQVDATNEGNWTWNIDGSGSYVMGSTQDVSAGDYEITENQQDGYHFVSLFCYDGEDQQGDTTTVSVRPGEDIECTYTNSRDTGSITVLKNIDWDENDGILGTHDNDAERVTNWKWDISGGEQDIATGQTRTLVTGEYILSEDSQDNYHLVGWSCDNDTSGSTNSIEVNLGSNEDIICTLTNSPDTGSIQGRKYNDVNGDGDFLGDEKTDENRLDEWTITLYSADWIQVDSMKTGDDSTAAGNVAKGQYRFVNVVPGNYYVCETPQNGWVQTEPNANSGIPHQNGTYCHEVTVGLGQDVTGVQFGNQGRGTITVYKNVDENGDGDLNDKEDVLGSTSWGFSLDNTDYTMGDTIDVAAGDYQLSEIDQDGYHFVSLFCYDDVNQNGDTTTLSVDPGQGVVCTYTNSRDTGTLIVHKLVDTNGDGTFDVTDDGDSNTLGFRWGFQNEGTTNEFGGKGTVLTTGGYTVEENDVNDYHLVGWYQGEGSCSEPQNTENSEALTDISYDQTTEITFCNQRDTGDIYGYKWNDFDGNTRYGEEPKLEGWTINLYENVEDTLGQLVATQDTDDSGNYHFELVQTGSYFVCEVLQTGWIQTFPLGCHSVTLEGNGDASRENNFGNQEFDPSVVIEKSNDKSSGASVGDTVNYTLVVTNDGNQPLNNLEVFDVLPGGFSYVAGSTKINSAPASDPTESNGKLTWTPPALGAGYSTTIEYQATIGDNISEGIYTNLATCTARVGGLFLNSNFPELDFLQIGINQEGSEEEIDCNVADSSVPIGGVLDISTSITGQVLGASTELPATGNSTKLLFALFGLALAGYGMKKYGEKMERKTKK